MSGRESRSGVAANGAREQRLALQAAAITLLAVLLSIGVTVAFGVSASWSIRLAAGIAPTVGLAVAIWLLGTRTSMLVCVTDWITGRSYRE